MPLGAALKQACSDHSWWLLFGGYFVCGFHVAFVGIHFPAFVQDQGLPSSVGATGLALIGHQVGAFLGAWLGGLIFDATQSYQWVWYISIALAFIASAANLPIRQTPPPLKAITA